MPGRRSGNTFGPPGAKVLVAALTGPHLSRGKAGLRNSCVHINMKGERGLRGCRSRPTPFSLAPVGISIGIAESVSADQQCRGYPTGKQAPRTLGGTASLRSHLTRSVPCHPFGLLRDKCWGCKGCEGCGINAGVARVARVARQMLGLRGGKQVTQTVQMLGLLCPGTKCWGLCVSQ